MIQMESQVHVADNTGARVAKMIGVIGTRSRSAGVGDIITAHIRESTPTANVKKGEVVRAVVVRTAAPIKRPDGSILRFDRNAVVLQVYRSKSQVVVEGVRMVKKHTRKSQDQPEGGIIEREGPIHISNVKLATSAKSAS